MKNTKQLPVDYRLFFAVVVLVIFWVIMMSSVSVYPSFKITLEHVYKGLIEEPYNYFYLKRNIIHVCTSFVLLAIIVKIPYQFFEKIAPHLLWLTTILLWYVHFFWATYKGAKGWIDIPLLPFNIQPTEMLKFSLIIFLAWFLKKNYKYIAHFKKGFLPFIGILGVFVAIVWLQPDFWTVMVIVPVSVIMFFLAGANIRYLFLLVIWWMIWAYWIYSAGVYDKEAWEARPKLAYITERIDYFLEDPKELFNPHVDYDAAKKRLFVRLFYDLRLWYG